MLNEKFIEPVQGESTLSKCPYGIRAFNSNGDVVHMACDQWRCDYCCKVLSYNWAQRVRYGLALWPLDAYHWTLTLPGQIYSPSFGFSVLKSAWDNLRKTCQRTLPYFHYAAFVEIHPKRIGIAHFHIITLHWSPGRINDVAHHAGFGYKATESTISGKEAANYVSKYTSKAGSVLPKGFRRVRLSREWPKLPLPAYEIPVLPIGKRESLSDYFQRVAILSNLTPSDCSARWEHKELDL